MFKLAETHLKAKCDHFKLLGNRTTLPAGMSTLRDIMMNITKTKTEAAKRASDAVSAKPVHKILSAQEIRNRHTLTTPGINVDWANKDIAMANKGATSSPLVANPFNELGSSDIRETVRRLQESQQKPPESPAKPAHHGAQALRSEILTKLSENQQASRASKSAEFDAKWGQNSAAGGPGGPGAPSVGEMFNRRFSQQQQNLAHKKAEFAARMNMGGTQLPMERSSDRPSGSDGYANSSLRGQFSSSVAAANTHNSYRADSRIQQQQQQQQEPVRTRVTVEPSSRYNERTGQMEVNVSALKAELLRKKAKEEEEAAEQFNNRKAPTTVVREVTLPAEGLTIRDLAQKLSMRVTELTRKLEDMGVVNYMKGPKKGKNVAKKHQVADEISEDSANNANPEDRMVDADSAELLVLEMGYNAKRVENKTAARTAQITDRPSTHASDETVVLVPRAPVVSTIDVSVSFSRSRHLHCEAL